MVEHIDVQHSSNFSIANIRATVHLRSTKQSFHNSYDISWSSILLAIRRATRCNQGQFFGSRPPSEFLCPFEIATDVDGSPTIRVLGREEGESYTSEPDPTTCPINENL